MKYGVNDILSKSLRHFNVASINITCVKIRAKQKKQEFFDHIFVVDVYR